MKVTFKLKKLSDNAIVPKYAHVGDAGMDLYSTGEVRIPPMSAKLVHTGIAIALPDGYEAQIRSRSGLALKSGVFVLNSPGTLDSCYRGEIGVILFNTTKNDFYIQSGSRVAQMVLAPITRGEAIVVEDLDETDRGDGGFGSTGITDKLM